MTYIKKTSKVIEIPISETEQNIVMKKKCKKIPPIVLIPLYGFLTGFKPSDPYLTPYLEYNRGFSKEDVVDKIYPTSTYSTPVFMALFALISPFIPSFKILLYFGYVCQLITFGILVWGTTLASMITMQVTYAATCAAEAVYFSVVYFFVDKAIYQKCSALSRSSILVAHVISAIIGQLLVSLIENFNQQYLFVITLIAEALNIIFLIMMPNGGANVIYENDKKKKGNEKLKAEEIQNTIKEYNSIEEPITPENAGINPEYINIDVVEEKLNLNEQELIINDNIEKEEEELLNPINNNNNNNNKCKNAKRLLLLFDAIRSDHLGISATVMSVIANAAHCLFINFAFNILDEINGKDSKLNGICSTVGRLVGVLGSFLAPIVLKHNRCFNDEKDMNIKVKTEEDEQKENELEVETEDKSAKGKHYKKHNKTKSKGAFASFAVSFCVIPCVFILLGVASIIYGITNTTAFTIVMFAVYYCLSEFALTMSWGCIALRTNSKAYPSVFVFTMLISYLFQSLIQITVFSNIAPQIFGLSVVRSHYIYIGFVCFIGTIVTGSMGIAHACKIKKHKKNNRTIEKGENESLLKE